MNHAKAILACDFFVTVTATCRLIYVFVVIERGRRGLARVDVTAHSSADLDRSALDAGGKAAAQLLGELRRDLRT